MRKLDVKLSEFMLIDFLIVDGADGKLMDS